MGVYTRFWLKRKAAGRRSGGLGRSIFRVGLEQVGELHGKRYAVADLAGAVWLVGGARGPQPVEVGQQDLKIVGEQLAPECRLTPGARQLLFRYCGEFGLGCIV